MLFIPIRDLLYLEVQKLLQSIFSRYLQKNSPSCCVLLISKVKKFKYQKLHFHPDICCNILQTELHIFFFLHAANMTYQFFIRYIQVIYKSCKSALEFGTALKCFKACCLSFSIKWTDIIVPSKCRKSN